LLQKTTAQPRWFVFAAIVYVFYPIGRLMAAPAVLSLGHYTTST
jgi:hypothetical protein